MKVQQFEDAQQGRFFIEEAGKTRAEMVYTLAKPATITIEHTEVAKDLRGKNVAHDLLDCALVYAREKHFKINPLCPFVKRVFDKNPELYYDVLIS